MCKTDASAQTFIRGQDESYTVFALFVLPSCVCDFGRDRHQRTHSRTLHVGSQLGRWVSGIPWFVYGTHVLQIGAG